MRLSDFLIFFRELTEREKEELEKYVVAGVPREKIIFTKTPNFYWNGHEVSDTPPGIAKTARVYAVPPISALLFDMTTIKTIVVYPQENSFLSGTKLLYRYNIINF